MIFKHVLAASIALTASATAVPASAVTNLLNNGSFEAGALGIGGYTGWTKTNVLSNAPASITAYNSNADYPTGAFGESVSPDSIVSASPDAVGGKAACFVGDRSVNENSPS